jgi:hypothetical protein
MRTLKELSSRLFDAVRSPITWLPRDSRNSLHTYASPMRDTVTTSAAAPPTRLPDFQGVTSSSVACSAASLPREFRFAELATVSIPRS